MANLLAVVRPMLLLLCFGAASVRATPPTDANAASPAIAPFRHGNTTLRFVRQGDALSIAGVVPRVSIAVAGEVPDIQTEAVEQGRRTLFVVRIRVAEEEHLVVLLGARSLLWQGRGHWRGDRGERTRDVVLLPTDSEPRLGVAIEDEGLSVCSGLYRVREQRFDEASSALVPASLQGAQSIRADTVATLPSMPQLLSPIAATSNGELWNAARGRESTDRSEATVLPLHSSGALLLRTDADASPSELFLRFQGQPSFSLTTSQGTLAVTSASEGWSRVVLPQGFLPPSSCLVVRFAIPTDLAEVVASSPLTSLSPSEALQRLATHADDRAALLRTYDWRQQGVMSALATRFASMTSVEKKLVLPVIVLHLSARGESASLAESMVYETALDEALRDDVMHALMPRHAAWVEAQLLSHAEQRIAEAAAIILAEQPGHALAILRAVDRFPSSRVLREAMKETARRNADEFTNIPALSTAGRASAALALARLTSSPVLQRAMTDLLRGSCAATDSTFADRYRALSAMTSLSRRHGLTPELHACAVRESTAEEWMLRALALDALAGHLHARSDSETMRGRLVEALRNDGTPRVREVAARGLTGVDSAVPVLEEVAVHDSWPRVRASAVLALRRRAGSNEVVRARLRDRSALVRKVAIESLAVSDGRNWQLVQQAHSNRPELHQAIIAFAGRRCTDDVVEPMRSYVEQGLSGGATPADMDAALAALRVLRSLDPRHAASFEAAARANGNRSFAQAFDHAVPRCAAATDRNGNLR